MHLNTQPAHCLLLLVGNTPCAALSSKSCPRCPLRALERPCDRFNPLLIAEKLAQEPTSRRFGPLGRAARRPGRLSVWITTHSQLTGLGEAGRDTFREWDPPKDTAA
jgi:hypothetical protein